jgi:hypothetical protein
MKPPDPPCSQPRAWWVIVALGDRAALLVDKALSGPGRPAREQTVHSRLEVATSASRPCRSSTAIVAFPETGHFAGPLCGRFPVPPPNCRGITHY